MTHQSRYLASLAGVAILILIAGWKTRPADREAPAPSETDLARLARLTERRTLESMPDYFAGVAASLEGAIVDLAEPAGSALVWDEGTLALSPEPGVHQTFAVLRLQGRDQQLVAMPTSAPGLPVAAVTVTSGGQPTLPPPAPRRTTPLQPGEWTAAIWAADSSRPFATGHFVQLTQRTCAGDPTQEVATTIPLQPLMVGAGLFDLDGQLIGMVVRCDGQPVAISAEAVDIWLARVASVERRFRALYGVTIATPTPGEAARFGATGVIVHEMTVGGPADRAGLAPGDVIVTRDGQAVSTPPDLASLATVDAAASTLGIVRGGRPLEISFPPREAAVAPAIRSTAPGAPVDVVLDAGTRTYRVVGLAADGAAAKAGLAVGDRILAIDHVSLRSDAQLRRALSDDKPTFLDVVRDGRRLGLLVPE